MLVDGALMMHELGNVGVMIMITKASLQRSYYSSNVANVSVMISPITQASLK